MASEILSRRHAAGYGLEKSLEAVRNPENPVPISTPSSEVGLLKDNGNSFTFDSFDHADALELGQLLYARLLPYANVESLPSVISISLASTDQTLFYTVVGPNALPDQENWIRRKKNTVLRRCASSWMLHCRFDGDEAAFAALFSMSTAQAGEYAIHGGAIPIRVKGVEGIVAIVAVSGLRQEEDHGVIMDVIRENWRIEGSRHIGLPSKF